MHLPSVVAMTKAELAGRTLREAIHSGQLRPGTRLVLQELSAELGMSYTPIREALRQLQSEGLVTYRAHYGTVVTEHSRERAEEIYRLRAVLEPLAASLAARHASDAQLEAIEGALAELTKAIREGRLDDVPALNAVLHRMITAAAGSEILTEFVERLWNGVPYQAISLRGRVGASAAEHQRIVDALRRRDSAAAAEEVRVHIANGADSALAKMSPAKPR
jgi:DNA-binding GntR family transcriptional regulator